MEATSSSPRSARSAEEPASNIEVQTLRRVVRDLVALSAMPSVWVEPDLRRSIQNLTDVVRAALRAFAVCVRIELPDGFRFETVSATGLTNASRPTHELSEVLDRPAPHSTALLRIPKFNGAGPVNALPRPIYSSEKQIGILIACYPADFRPDENAQLILHVAANQLDLLLERYRDQEERFARALAEERLRKTEHHYQQLVQALPAAVYTCDGEGRITMFNEAAARLWGRRPILGEDTWCGAVRIFNTDLTPLPIEDCPIAVAIREGRTVRGKEIVIERPDGTRSHVLPHPDPIRDEKGGIVGAVNMLVDISPLKRAENEARASENRLQLLLNLMPAAVYACDAEGRITFFNRRAAELWGREPSLNDDHQKFCAAYRCWIGNDALVPEQTPMALAVREGKSFRNLEPTFERPDGKRVPVLVNIDPLFDRDGKPAGAINVFQDVTALKQAQEALRDREEWHRATFHQAAVGIASASLDGALVEVNSKFCEVFGYTSDEMRKLKISDITHPEDRPRTAEKMRLLLSGETSSYAYEKRFLRKDGQIVWANVTVTTIKGAAGKPTRFVGVLEDITQRKQVEAELGRRTKELTAFFETAAVALHWVGPDGRILWANAAEMEMLGYSPEEYIGRHVSEIHADPDVIEQILNQLGRGEKIGDREARLKCKDGSIRHVLIDSSVLWEDGNFIHTQCFTRDITDRKRAEERLQKRGERLQLLSETLGQLLSARDPNLIVRELFPKVAEHLGVDTYFNFMVNGRQDVLVLHSCAGIPDEIARQIRELRFGQAICGTVAQTRAPIHAMDIQNSTYEKANLVRGFGLQCYACNPLIAGDRLLGTLSFASRTRKAFDEDELQFLQLISQYTAVALDRLQSGVQLRESEERFRNIFNQTTAGIAQIDLDGRFLLVNQRFCDITGYSAEQLIAKTYGDLTFPEDQACDRAMFENALRERQPSFIEIRYVRPDGTLVWVRNNVSQMTDGGGRVQRMLAVSIDITEQKRAEEQLRNQRGRLEQDLADSKLLQELSATLVQEDNADVLYHKLLDAAASIMRAEMGSMQILDEREDALRLLATRGFGPDFRESFLCCGRESPTCCNIARQLRQRLIVPDIQKWEVIAGTPAAKKFQTLGIAAVQSTPLVSRTGKLVGMISTHWREPHYPTERDLRLLDVVARQAADLLERRHAEAALRESEERFRAVLNNSTTVIYVKDVEGRYLLINRSFEELFHIREPDLLGKTDFDLFAAKDAEGFRQNDLEVIRTGKPLEIEEVAPHDDGPHTYISVKFPLRRDGAIYAVAGISTDITERKRVAESAARLAAIVEHSDDAILSVDLDGVIKSWNRGAERLYGYRTGEAIGQNVLMLVPDGRQDEEPNILGRIRQGQTVENYETQRRRKDDSVLDVSLTVSPIKDSAGNIIGASKVARDITEKTRAREILEQTVATRTASLREAIAQMEEFSYTVSHDLRAPLRAMQGYSDVLLQEHASRLDPDAMRYLRRIAENSTRLDKMILDVLTFSRLARADFKLELVSLNALVRSVVENYEDLQPPKAIIQVDCPHEILGHEPSLVQAISNLLTNAVKFVAPGKTPSVQVSSEQEGETVTIRVRDNGIGVPPQYHSRLFNMFERVHPNLKYDGTGVGLAIVRKAVERMGGKVGMESDGVNGSCFWIQLRAAGALVSK